MYGGMKVSQARRRGCVEHLQEKLGVSESRAWEAIGQSRSTQRRVFRVRDEMEVLRAAIVTLAGRYGRYGSRRITALLRRDGWRVEPEGSLKPAQARTAVAH